MTLKDDDIDDIKFADEGESKEESNLEEIPREKRVLRTQAYDKSVSDLVAMMEGDNKDIFLDPHYQRSYIWDNKKASLLVESILLNVPIPVIYVAEDEDSRWNVVDGLQRLNSLRRFFDNEFKLTGLEVLPELNRLQFSTLNPKAQRLLKNGILRVIVILQESHPEIKYDIFLRLNRGAVRLNEQELRNCLYRGSLNTFIKELRKEKKFQEILGLKSPHPRYIDAELALRSLALTQCFDAKTGTINNYAGKMKGFLNSFMHENQNMSDDKTAKLRESFVASLTSASEVFGNDAFRRIDAKTRVAERQLNRAIFDLVMVGFSSYSLDKISANKKEIIELFVQLPENDKKFLDAITYGTNDKAKVEYRLSTWTRELSKLLK